MLVGSAVVYPLLCEVIAGFSGGACKTLAFYPLDTLTTWRETRQSGSMRELYRGCLLTVAGGAPYAAVFHTAFWASEHALTGLPPSARQMAAGSCGALTAAAIWVPFECIKHRVQVAAPGCATPRAALRTTLKREGVRGLYAGMSATLMRKCATAPPDRPTTGVTRHTRCVESHACAPALRSVPYNALHFGIFAAAGRVSRALGLPGAPFWVADVRATPSWHCQWSQADARGLGHSHVYSRLGRRLIGAQGLSNCVACEPSARALPAVPAQGRARGRARWRARSPRCSPRPSTWSTRGCRRAAAATARTRAESARLAPPIHAGRPLRAPRVPPQA